jgi:penicillin G amidase
MRWSRLLFGLVLGRRLPWLDGVAGVAGATGEVVIRRDQWGVPHVDAQSEADAWFGLGFCHGQDRAFQLESLVRVIRGTLAELAGPGGLAVDRLSRRIGFRRSALRQLSVLDPDVLANLGSYSAGVTEGLRRRPHELVLLRGRTTLWDAADVLAMSKLMAFLLPANWDSELARLKLLQLDGPEALRALDAAYPEWLPVTIPPGAAAGTAVDRLAEDLDRFLAVTGLGGGSNNWVVAGSRTATGRPILANDPHLAPSTPPHFYLADLCCPDWHAAGASLVGTFGIFAGHNDTAAWGVTAGCVDNTDLCVEEVGADMRSVRRGDRFVPCEVIEETIRVKGRAPVIEQVLITPQGPVIGPALDGEAGAVSLRATWLEPRPLRGLLDLVRCTSAEDFHTRLAHFPSSSMNVVFATTDGHIGYQLAGEPPRRRAGNGAFPASGHDAEAGWDSLVAFADMPRDLDPACGWIATANNKPATDDAGPFISVDFPGGYRAARIGEVLTGRDDWDVSSLARLQLDVFSIPWREMRDTVLAAPADPSRAGTVTQLLADWDGHVAAGSAAASVFELLVAELASRVAHAKAPHSAQWALGRGFTPLMTQTLFTVHQSTLARLVHEQPDGWFAQPWPDIIAAALETVQRRLTARYGPSPDRWAWGEVRPLRFLHAAGARRPLGRVLNHGPLPGSGDANTIAQAAVNLDDPTANTFFTPGLRMVIDVGNWQDSRWALPGGQSGNPTSPHYDDQLQPYQNAEGIPIPWTAHDISATTHHTLHLQPTPARTGPRETRPS